MNKLKPYRAYSVSAGRAEGAILVIAPSVKVAKSLAWPVLRDWNCEEWIDMATNWIRSDRVLLLADQEKLATSIPHVIESPRCCPVCHLWSEQLDAQGQYICCV